MAARSCRLPLAVLSYNLTEGRGRGSVVGSRTCTCPLAWGRRRSLLRLLSLLMFVLQSPLRLGCSLPRLERWTRTATPSSPTRYRGRRIPSSGSGQTKCRARLGRRCCCGVSVSLLLWLPLLVTVGPSQLLEAGEGSGVRASRRGDAGGRARPLVECDVCSAPRWGLINC